MKCSELLRILKIIFIMALSPFCCFIKGSLIQLSSTITYLKPVSLGQKLLIYSIGLIIKRQSLRIKFYDLPQ